MLKFIVSIIFLCNFLNAEQVEYILDVSNDSDIEVVLQVNELTPKGKQTYKRNPLGKRMVPAGGREVFVIELLSLDTPQRLLELEPVPEGNDTGYIPAWRPIDLSQSNTLELVLKKKWFFSHPDSLFDSDWYIECEHLNLEKSVK